MFILLITKVTEQIKPLLTDISVNKNDNICDVQILILNSLNLFGKMSTKRY